MGCSHRGSLAGQGCRQFLESDSPLRLQTYYFPIGYQGVVLAIYRTRPIRGLPSCSQGRSFKDRLNKISAMNSDYRQYLHQVKQWFVSFRPLLSPGLPL
ncbi:hypothetical protein FGO68_gene10771 [Halteria grandinella]|uniref:Uncharacterized protein n=1 Tax=Halteria grandinella TaxID=5974 RepID=A0A8J8SXD5_HALGN|nr:hypothetical protein FGO68_gene10771 [Halteria grandinella]